MSKKIVLFGSNGQLGTEIKNQFISKNVISYPKKDLDITNKNMLNESFRNIYDDIVINASAYTNVDGAEDDFNLAKDVNSNAAGCIAINCEKKHSYLFITQLIMSLMELKNHLIPKRIELSQ